VLALLGLACSDPRLHRRPADVVFSVGVWDGAGGPPQSSGPVTLAFGAAEAGPAAVVAAYLARPVVVDGDPAEWSAIPASEIPISSAGARTGLTEADFYCRYRSRLALVTDPFTGASGCPTACDPANRPATRDEASAGCSLPFPRFDHDVARLTVKAGYDEHRLYLLLQWPDPSEDRGARTWRFDPDAATWLAGSEAEDRAAVSFDGGSVPSSHAALGCAGACHLAGPIAAPAPGTPPGLIAPAYLAQFTMHTDGDGQRVDAWEWRAAGTDPLGLADDLFWNAQRLQGDCPTPGACLDACLLSPAGPGCASLAPSVPNALAGSPLYLAAGESGLGDPDLSPALLFLPGDAAPGWDPALTAVAPAVGPFPAPVRGAATLPGLVLQRPGAHRDDVTAVGRWRDGHWTVELSRALVTDDPADAQFPLR
jgi:hypothetical protein